MKQTSKQIVFFGSGPVAAASLDSLAEDFDIECVITKPRPPHHKGAVPVLDVCKRLKLRCLTADSKQQLSEVVGTQNWQSRVAVLVDFGIIVEQKVIDAFPLGIINSHFSLLPQWRGADPITWSILSGQSTTGVSLMLLVAAMDEGPILCSAPCQISEHTTEPDLTKQLLTISNDLLRQSIPHYLTGDLQPTEQLAYAAAHGYDTQASYSRKLTKADAKLDFHKPANQLEREVRAFLGWPGSRMQLAGKDVIVCAAHAVDGKGKPGSLYRQVAELGIYTSDGILMLDEVKPAGKNRMPIRDFLAGYGQQL